MENDQPTPEPSRSVLRKKDVETVIHQNDQDPTEEGGGAKLQKRLGALDLMGVGIGMVIGTGIFTLTGVQAKYNAGPAVVIAFLVAGVVSLLAALCYSELASSVPTAGSAYTYAYTTMGEIFAWIIAWDLVLEFALGASVVARGWSGYLGSMLGLPTQWFGEKSTVNIGAVIITLVLGLIAARGIKESKFVTNALVVVKVSVCVFVVALGAFFVKTQNWVPFVPPSAPSDPSQSKGGLREPLWQFVTQAEPTAFGVPGILMATAVVFFAYSGFEVVANMGEEAKNPAKDMPKGIIGTLLICTLLYMAVCLVVTGMVHYTDLDEGAPIAEAFKAVGQGWAGILISIAALCGLTSVILIDIIAMGRIMFAMSRDGLLPPSVGHVNPKTNTPTRVTWATTIAVATLSALVPLKDLADMVSIGTLFAFFIVSLAVIVLRRTRPDMERPFRVPLAPFVPAVSALACAALMASLGVDTWIRFVVWMALGLFIYFVYGRRHSHLGRGESASTSSME
ncbi:amino acid permease [Mariniluteicoccus endophyticus]